MQDDLFAYKQQQRQTWGSSIGLHRLSGEFAPASQRLIEWLGIGPDDHVLDVATGTGRTAVLARMTGASVEAVDISPVLIGEAEHFALASGFPDIHFTEADAEELPYPNDAFTVVTSTFGIIHAPRPDVVSREMDRVLAFGGRLGLATWRHDATLHELVRLIPGGETQVRGVVNPAEWGRRERVREFISQRYFPNLEFEEGELLLSYPTVDAAWRDWSRNYGPIRSAYQAIPLRNRDGVDAAARDFFARWADDSGAVHWPLAYMLVKATKIGLAQRVG
ncbi:MAG TPA: methyltransferase domain-containing protein [Thermomicrobiales bacterium]|nr:methyltransferase domain-containing protein [Thermomicrobiales bacterium]